MSSYEHGYLPFHAAKTSHMLGHVDDNDSGFFFIYFPILRECGEKDRLQGPNLLVVQFAWVTYIE